jgi:hypothetical protein
MSAKDITLDELDKWLTHFRADVMAKIADFEERTGCVVDSIDLEHRIYNGSIQETVDLAIILKI